MHMFISLEKGAKNCHLFLKMRPSNAFSFVQVDFKIHPNSGHLSLLSHFLFLVWPSFACFSGTGSRILVNPPFVQQPLGITFHMGLLRQDRCFKTVTPWVPEVAQRWNSRLCGGWIDSFHGKRGTFLHIFSQPATDKKCRIRTSHSQQPEQWHEMALLQAWEFCSVDPSAHWFYSQYSCVFSCNLLF